MSDYLPPGFEFCPEEFDKIKLIASDLFKWELVDFTTEFLDDMGSWKVWKDQYGNIRYKADKFNPFVSLNDAFLVLNGMRQSGTWTLEFPDPDNTRATFTPNNVDTVEVTPFQVTPVSFICCSTQNAITTVAYRWLLLRAKISNLQLDNLPA